MAVTDPAPVTAEQEHQGQAELHCREAANHLSWIHAGLDDGNTAHALLSAERLAAAAIHLVRHLAALDALRNDGAAGPRTGTPQEHDR
ncbi:hypothetical protein [Actinoplanes sp. L3-i22]|uniref:hypothetical protein n=1 Tax=Actinoplanes sp. L3-i22 TaxID=2836373 RepID=UPI001C77ADD7|nr:hypothetical protein [Actinoplanes sp. L3-i22]BCY10959.1 hypothetical protein L3i22_060470 [Actinoplanes sp. L3-i22]